MEEKRYTNKQQRELRQQGKKGCQNCGEIKLLDEFTKAGKLVNGDISYSGLCLICNNKRTSSYNDNNINERKKSVKKYNQNNKDKYNLWLEENKEHYMEYRRNYMFNRYNTEDEFRFMCIIQGHLQGVKNRQEFKDLWDDVREVYDFYGVDYHIDHKVPKSWFKVSSPKYIINHLDNLQVIDAEYNLSKGNKWSDPVPSDYLDKIRPYIKKEFQGLLKSL